MSKKTTIVPKVTVKTVKLIKGQRNARLFHPTKGEMDLGTLSQKDLLTLYNEKGYRHLFE